MLFVSLFDERSGFLEKKWLDIKFVEILSSFVLEMAGRCLLFWPICFVFSRLRAFFELTGVTVSVISKILQTYRTAYAGLPREVWLISAALLINRFGTMVLPFLMLYLTRELEFGETSAGSLLSVYGFGAIIGTYFGGRLTDRVGAIRLQILLLFGSVPMFLALPFCSSWTSIAACLFALSVFSEGVRPANSTAVAQMAPEGLQTRAFALQRMALNLGFSFGPVIGGLLTTISFFWLFVVDAGTTFLCAVALILFFGFGRNLPTFTPLEEEAVSSIAPVSKGIVEPTEEASPFDSPWRDRRYLSFLGLLLIGSIIFFQFQSTYPLYLQDHYGLSELGIGLIFSVNTLVIILFEMVLVEYVRRWRLLVLVGWGCFFSCLGFGILPYGDTVLFCVFSMLLLSLGEMLSMPLSSGWVAQRSRNSDQGWYMGLYSMNYSVAFLIAPALGGAIYEIDSFQLFSIDWSGPELIWNTSILVGILVLLGFCWLDRLGRQRVGSRCLAE